MTQMLLICVFNVASGPLIFPARFVTDAKVTTKLQIGVYERNFYERNSGGVSIF